MDWNKLKKEYVKGGISYRQLSEKYGVPFGTLKRHALEEEWGKLRAKAKQKADTKLLEAVSDRNAKVGADIYAAADLLLRRLTESVEALDAMDSQSLRQYTAALKDLKDIKNIRSERDLREQEARIAKLIRDAQKDEDGGNATVVVTFASQEGEAEWAK